MPEALKIAEQIGYPVIAKASAGGGGRGMVVAHVNVDTLWLERVHLLAFREQ